MSFIGLGLELEDINTEPISIDIPSVYSNAGYLIEHGEKWYFIKKDGDNKIKEFGGTRTNGFLLDTANEHLNKEAGLLPCDIVQTYACLRNKSHTYGIIVASSSKKPTTNKKGYSIVSYNDYFEAHSKNELHYNLQSMAGLCNKVSSIQKSWQLSRKTSVQEDEPMLQADNEPEQDDELMHFNEPEQEDNEPEQEDNNRNKRIKIGIKDWSSITRDDLPDIKIIIERIDIENLRAFAASPESLKTIRELKKGVDQDEEETTHEDVAGRVLVLNYLKKH
jgi:hypothetical protein